MSSKVTASACVVRGRIAPVTVLAALPAVAGATELNVYGEAGEGLQVRRIELSRV